MRKNRMWKKLAAAAGSTMLAAALTVGGCAAVTMADEEETELELDKDGLWDEEELTAEDLEDDVDEDLSPEDQELQEYMDANLSSALVEVYGSLLYTQSFHNEDGTDNDQSGTIYVDSDTMDARYIDKYELLITKDEMVGYATDLDAPVRYVWDSEERKEEAQLDYEEFFYLWGDESVTGKSEQDGKITFTTEMDGEDMLGWILSEFGQEYKEGDVLQRDTVFDIDSKVLESSVVKIIHEDGDSYALCECTLELNPEKGYEENSEMLEKLHSEDTHSLTLTLNPGGDEEQVITSTVGRGCAFSLLLYDGYTLYTDEACTAKAENDLIYSTEKDIVLYGAFEEVYDEDMELDDGDYELSIDGDEELDLSELFADAEDEDVAG